MSVCVHPCVFLSGFDPPDQGILSQSTIQRFSLVVLVLARYFRLEQARQFVDCFTQFGHGVSLGGLSADGKTVLGY
jgi:hypothetical protein